MSEWWTYTLSDFLLFSPRTYRRLVELYNAQTWPLHLLAVAIGIVVSWLTWRGGAHRRRVAVFALAPCWAWVGLAFFARHYASINWAAPYFAAGFVAQAVMLAIHGALAPPSERARVPRVLRWSGASLLAFGLFLQPLIGPLLGRPISQIEVFGMSPDPTVTVTLGVLALSPGGGMNALLWVAPLLWCVLAGATLWTMHDADAWVMPAVAVTALWTAWAGRPSRLRRQL